MKAAARSRRDRIRTQLADLKMPGALEALDDVSAGVDSGSTAAEAVEQPSIKREQIDSLHELGFLERMENVVFFGPPGVAIPISRSA